MIKIHPTTKINGDIYVSGIGDLTIGKYCAIGANLTVATSEHNYHCLNLQDALQKDIDGQSVLYSKGLTHIKNNVWIGHNVTILSGNTINNGAVIGAGSIVTKDLNAYGVYAGNPASFIRYRFNGNIRQELESLKFWDWPLKKMRHFRKIFCDLSYVESIYDIVPKRDIEAFALGRDWWKKG